MGVMEQILEEIEILKSIYGDDFVSIQNDSIVTVRVASLNAKDVNRDLIHIEFVLNSNYPEFEAPEVSISFDPRSFVTCNEVAEASISCWNPGCTCIFDMVEFIRDKLSNEEINSTETQSIDEIEHEIAMNDDFDWKNYKGDSKQTNELKIVTTQPFIERKSVFVGHACYVKSLDDVKTAVEHIKSDNRVARATHNMFAYRFLSPSSISRDEDIFVVDHDSDGEDAAGGRMANLLNIADIRNVFVLVTRWYGGVKLGPDRFRIINQVARNAMELLGAINPGAQKGK
eukprot:GDKK01028092.1.p1 GENE.GDKK01028092.1~~GDKK01028092.1.p1  ORF type:complete len:286 (+),score=57.25 GDKK01028092.1:1-858(+)